MRLLVFSALALLISLPLSAREVMRVHATGYGYVAGPTDTDAARLRALGEALLSAALAGGAEMQSATVLQNTRVTYDMSVLRAAGRVISHRVTHAALQANGMWRVDIEAQVAPPQRGDCRFPRRLTVALTPPTFRLDPNAPAWTGPLAETVSDALIAAWANHPNTARLQQVRGDRPGAAMDYQSLVQSGARPAQNDHQASLNITITQAMGRLELIVEIELRAPDGERHSFTIRRDTAAPNVNATRVVFGGTRTRAEAALSDQIAAEAKTILDAMSCQPARGIMAYRDGGLQVRVGRENGLTPNTLAVMDDRTGGFGLLRIANLTADMAILTPLDQTVEPARLDGSEVYFVELGL